MSKIIYKIKVDFFVLHLYFSQTERIVCKIDQTAEDISVSENSEVSKFLIKQPAVFEKPEFTPSRGLRVEDAKAHNHLMPISFPN